MNDAEYYQVRNSYSSSESIYNLKASTTYYVQQEVRSHVCENAGEVYSVKSEIVEFRTNEYDPTRYTIYPDNLPMKGYYGVFTIDGSGSSQYEQIYSSYEMRPGTMVTSESKVYVTAPYISSAKDPKAVTLNAGDDFYYGSGSVSAANPYVKLTMKRFMVNVTVKIAFKATKDEVYNLSLYEVTVANAKGDTPLCSTGTLDLTTGKFTPVQNAGATYYEFANQSLKSGTTYSHTFYNMFPVSFGDNEVKVGITLSGDVKEKEVSLPVPGATWSEGSDVTINLTAEYSATSVELTVTGIEVKPWEEGSTGNIDITK